MSRPRLNALRYRRRILAIGLGLALLVFCVGFPIVNNRIEADLERRVPEELAEAGFTGITASFTGQDGTLTCAAPLDDPEAATAAAFDVWGVRTVTLDRDCRVNRAPVVDGETSDTATDTSAAASATTAAQGEFGTIADAVTGNPDLTYLTVLVAEAGLADQLANPEADPGTLFAPSDEAFEALPADVNAQLRADPALLAEVLGAHIVTGAVASSDLVAGPLTTLDGSRVDVTITDGTIAVDGARVVAPDTVTGNGVVHVIEQVLLPDGFEAVTQAPRSPVQAVLEAGTITLDGVVASEVERQSLLDVATAAVGAGNVVDRLTVDPDTGLDRDNTAALAILIAEMTTNLSNGTAGFDGTALFVNGTYADEAAREAMTASAETVGATANLEPPSEEAAAEAEQLETTLNEVVAADPIRFEVNAAVLTDEAGVVLDDLAARLGDATRFAITIEGHTDSDGDAAANLALSQQRAEAVLAALVERGVPAASLTAEGFGETQPVLVNGVEDKDASRRVEFRIEAIG